METLTTKQIAFTKLVVNLTVGITRFNGRRDLTPAEKVRVMELSDEIVNRLDALEELIDA